MSDWIGLVSALGGGLAGLGAGGWLGARWAAARSRRALDEQRERSRQELGRQRRELERAQQQLVQTRRDASVSLWVGDAREPAPERASARHLERFVARLRGLATMDEALVALPDGLAATPCQDAALARAGALSATLATLTAGSLAGFVALQLQPRRGAQLSYRLLPSWTGGAWLLARGRGEPVNTLALDAAIAGAFRGQQSREQLALSLSGARHEGSEAHAHALRSEVDSGSFHAAALSRGQELIAYAASDGPEPGAMGQLAAACALLCARAAHLCGPISSLRLQNAAGRWLACAPGADGFALLVVGSGGLDELALERVRGQLRRAGAPLSAAEPRHAIEEALAS